LSAPDSPTADLYLRNACGDYLDGPIRQLAPTVFTSEHTCLVMRHALRAGALPERRRLIYMIDDDVEAGTRDPSLPFLYRQKLRMVEQPAERRLTRTAGVAVVASQALARVYAPLMETHVLRPYWSEPFASLDHFDMLDGSDAMVDLAYLGSIVHKNDLEFLLPVLACLLARHQNLRIHVPERHVLPLAFDQHPRVLRIPGLGWTAYRDGLQDRRYHIALYPLLDTPFNRARSLNKLIEHAVVGAAPIYSAGWTENASEAHGISAIRVPNRLHAWAEAASALIRAPQRAREIARGAQRLAARLNDPRPQRQLWHRLFELKESARA
ncbi:MAG: hypothetical protein AAF479_09130, partial [Pseudomonadota bacterium]